jgi:hypothetical protein
VFCRTVMFAVPTSPLVLNLTPSLVAVITTAAAAIRATDRSAGGYAQCTTEQEALMMHASALSAKPSRSGACWLALYAQINVF